MTKPYLLAMCSPVCSLHQGMAVSVILIFSLMVTVPRVQDDSKLLFTTGENWTGNLGGLSGEAFSCDTHLCLYCIEQ